jgi:hypothetical protein
MPEFKPFPVADKIADLLVDLTNLPREEACQPCNVRHFFNDAASQIEKAPVEREDRKIQFDNIEVEISILRPIGSKGKKLPVILFL